MKFKRHIVFLCLIPFLNNCTWFSSGEKNSSGQNFFKAEDNKVVLHQARSADAKTLDPQAQFDSISGLFVRSLYDTLLDYHYLKRPYELIPVLLEEMPEISEDKKTLTFKLKKGIHFSDDPCFEGGKGRELVTDDVLYTIKRFADINVNAMSWFLLSDSVVGLDDMREKTKKILNLDYDKEQVKGLEKIDSYTFKIHLIEPNPLALYSLAASSLSIIPKEAVTKYGDDFSRHPVGTGAFYLKEYRKKQTMTFVKNENYFMHYPKDLANDFKIYTEPGLVTSYIVFNMKDNIAQNKNLRKAIAHAIDFKKKIELLSNGRVLTLGTIVPLSIGGSEKDIGNYGIPFDLEKARDYMKKSGYGDKPLQLVMTIGGTTTIYQNLYEFLRDSLDKIGIDLKPDYKTWPSYLKSTQIGDFQMATAAWTADYPDPENFYQLLFSENTRGSAFKNDEYDKLYDEMRFMQNSPERFEIIKKMAQILQEEVPVIFDSTPLVSGLVQNWLTNFKRNIMVDYPFKYLSVSQKSEKTVAQK